VQEHIALEMDIGLHFLVHLALFLLSLELFNAHYVQEVSYVLGSDVLLQLFALQDMYALKRA
jgi:hypothetical protein